ncbi:MAG: 3-hydroxyacyl-CoA dehydrogenase NAD-binding domain-containing protein [Bacteroidales bacterium]|jgi:3-hydroxybutyryl-CoA dehydrogenase|nr:3-hydroxyacyl-CoA dehydrogenase NAD-binding domain-containing protein [Bacteroidales bacterium]MCU0407747.1 3-hydroxyacyl-CoA dehydrogenase NAD-binding domain-containing protein [Bacteroidales bacterium]
MADNIERLEDYGLSKDSRPKTLFSRVGIVGAGSVGQNIARMVSSRGLDVVFLELSQQKIDKAFADIARELDRMIERWGMTNSEKLGILSRIKGTTDYNDFSGCDLVIEAVKSTSREHSHVIRAGILKKIEQHVERNTIIATNSSTQVITELTADLEHKDRCVSFHFLTPEADARIVEVVKGLYTSQDAYENTVKFANLIGKRVIPVKESPGIISTRLIVPFINEACEILMEGVGSMEDIDTTMKVGFGLPLGPFEMADKIGLDKILRWCENLYDEFGDLKYKSSPLLKKLVRANHFGRRTGRGFYEYSKDGVKINRNDFF